LESKPFDAIKRYKNKKNYIYAIVLLRANKFKEARSIIDELIKQHPDQILFKMTKAEIEGKSNNNQKALDILSKLHDYNSSYYPVSMQYADILIKNNNAKKAVEILKSSRVDYSDKYAYLNLLFQAQGKSGEKSAAYQTRSKIYLFNGHKKAAIQQLKLALSSIKHNTYEKQKIKAQLDKLQ